MRRNGLLLNKAGAGEIKAQTISAARAAHWLEENKDNECFMFLEKNILDYVTCANVRVEVLPFGVFNDNNNNFLRRAKEVFFSSEHFKQLSDEEQDWFVRKVGRPITE